MARARNIKPGFFQNEKLGSLPPSVRLFFIGLWTIADYRGVIEWRPLRVKIQLAPYDKGDVNKWLNLLVDSQFVSKFEVNGNSYVKILEFERHQSPHKNEIKSGTKLPDITDSTSYEEKSRNSDDSTTEPLALIADSGYLIPDSSLKESGSADADPPTKPVDPRKVHPAVIAVWKTTGKYPSKDVWDTLIETMGSDIDEVKLKKCWVQWRARGFKPTNFAWALEWYIDGIPEKPSNGTNRINQNGRRTNVEKLRATRDIINQYPTEAELRNQS